MMFDFSYFFPKKDKKMIDIHKVLLYNTCRRALWQKQVKIILAGEEF